MNFYKKYRKQVLMIILAGVALILVFAIAFAADVNIDTFSDTSQYADHRIRSSDSFPITECDYDSTATNESLGDHRDLCLIINEGDVDAYPMSMVSSDNDYLDQSLPTSVKAYTSVQWDGTDATSSVAATGLQVGGAGKDLTDNGSNDGILLRVIGSDGVEFDLVARIYTNATNWAEQTVTFDSTVDSNEIVDVFMPFDDFSDRNGSMDESDVGAVEIRLDSTANYGADVTIDLVKATSVRDYGDLPADYSSVSHVTDGLRLGDDVDAEGSAHTSSDATGDNTNDADDETGVARDMGDLWTNGSTVDITVDVSGCASEPCRLNGWIDWNDDNDFADTNDQIFDDQSVTNGTNSLTISVPSSSDYTVGNDIFVRFRLCDSINTCDNTTDGNEVTGGEVEDYFWKFSPTAVSLQSFSANNSSSTLPVAAVLGLVVLALVSVGFYVVRKQNHAA